jgi:ketosteroid isomerase-like protein
MRMSQSRFCGRKWVGPALAVVIMIGCAPLLRAQSEGEGLGAVESAFAATMADRDLEAFVGFLDAETVFFSGPTELRGAEAVKKAWAPFFEGEAAPFSWRPEMASVLDSGSLGLTSGPVFDPEGNRIGTFNSIWRLNTDGVWKIVFDRGCP